MKRFLKPALLPLLLLFVIEVPLKAVETEFWQIGSFNEFLKGTLSGVSLSREGELQLAPATRAIFSPEEALALSLVADRNHNLYVGTGHQGKVFRLDRNLKPSLFFTAKEPDIFALAIGPDNDLYVGSSPEGKVYRVTPDGKSEVFFDPKVKYIWAMVFDPQGDLYVGTGDQGLIYKVDRSGKGHVFFDSKETHIMCLSLDREGNLLAGSAPDGLIYRITPQGKAFVLYQASLPEIHQMVTDREGRIYATALGGPAQKGMPPGIFVAPGSTTHGHVTPVTVTVTASQEIQNATKKKQKPPAGKSENGQSFNRIPTQNFGLVLRSHETQGRGALIQIQPDNTVETIWSSEKESIFGLAMHGNQILFSTGSNGRVFDLNPTRYGEKLTLLTETHESLATQLLSEGSHLYIATSNVARLFRMAASPSPEGTFESPVEDTKFISHWGVLAWRGDIPVGTKLEFYTRSGNSNRPDRTWSNWMEPKPSRDPNSSRIQSPPARYIQWKAVLRGSKDRTPVLDDVTLSYLNQNLPPQIRSLNVVAGSERSSVSGLTVPIISSGNAKKVTVTSSATSNFGFSSAAESDTNTPVTLAWQAEDPNGDDLVYSLYIKSADESAWHLLKNKLQVTSYQIEPGTLPDGKYVARLVASDKESNPPDMAKRAELVSTPFWIDNTPPEVRVLKQSVGSEHVRVQFEAEDGTSPLRSAEFSVDGKEWKQVLSDDGIVDSRTEDFTIRIPKPEPGEHVISLRAFDTAGNAGVGKAVIEVGIRKLSENPAR